MSSTPSVATLPANAAKDTDTISALLARITAIEQAYQDAKHKAYEHVATLAALEASVLRSNEVPLVAKARVEELEKRESAWMEKHHDQLSVVNRLEAENARLTEEVAKRTSQLDETILKQIDLRMALSRCELDRDGWKREAEAWMAADHYGHLAPTTPCADAGRYLAQARAANDARAKESAHAALDRMVQDNQAAGMYDEPKDPTP